MYNFTQNVGWRNAAEVFSWISSAPHLAHFEIEVDVWCELKFDAAVQLWGGTSREWSLKNMKRFAEHLKTVHIYTNILLMTCEDFQHFQKILEKNDVLCKLNEALVSLA